MFMLALQGTERANGQTWQIVGHSLAKGIDESTGRPVGNTTRFLSTDGKAVCWFEIEVEGSGPLSLTWRWFEPEGTVFREHRSVELVPRSGSYRFWDLLPIRDTPVEVKPGRWLVEVLVKTERLFRTPFLIELPATSYSIRVKVTGLDKRLSTSLYVDGSKIGTISEGETKEFTFRIGTVHKLMVDERVHGGETIRFRCGNNSVSLSSELLQIFLYEPEYYLKVISEFGSSAGEGWYRAGSMASFSVSASVTGPWGTRYLFRHWTGDYMGDSASGAILMDGPKEVRALWVADYSQLYTFVGVATGAVAMITVIAFVARRRRPLKSAEPERPAPLTRKCPQCGKQVLYIERIKRYYCTHCRKYL